MPYFLFELHSLPVKHARLLSEYTTFREASQAAKAIRARAELPTGCVIKLMHGENALHAEDLMLQERIDTRNPGDD